MILHPFEYYTTVDAQTTAIIYAKHIVNMPSNMWPLGYFLPALQHKIAISMAIATTNANIKIIIYSKTNSIAAWLLIIKALIANVIMS